MYSSVRNQHPKLFTTPGELSMDREKFEEILKEYGYNATQIDLLWESRPHNNIKEEDVRKRAAHTAPVKDQLIQA